MLSQKGEEEIAKMVRPTTCECFSLFFPRHLCLHLTVVCVLVGGQSIESKSIEIKKPEVGEMPSHIQVRGREKHFLPAMLMFLDFFTSLDYFFPRKRNNSRY